MTYVVYETTAQSEGKTMTRNEFRLLLKTATITPECQFDEETDRFEGGCIEGCVWNTIRAPGFKALWQSFYNVKSGDASLDSLEYGDNYGLETWWDGGTAVVVTNDGEELSFDDLEELVREVIPTAFDFNLDVIIYDRVKGKELSRSSEG